MIAPYGFLNVADRNGVSNDMVLMPFFNNGGLAVSPVRGADELLIGVTSRLIVLAFRIPDAMIMLAFGTTFSSV